jgi:hypothetical protein
MKGCEYCLACLRSCCKHLVIAAVNIWWLACLRGTPSSKGLASCSHWNANQFGCTFVDRLRSQHFDTSQESSHNSKDFPRISPKISKHRPKKSKHILLEKSTRISRNILGKKTLRDVGKRAIRDTKLQGSLWGLRESPGCDLGHRTGSGCTAVDCIERCQGAVVWPRHRWRLRVDRLGLVV